MPWCSWPSRRTRSETPVSTSIRTLSRSRMPARTVSSISRRLRLSTTTESMPDVASRCDSIRPAGPPPTMPTVVRVGLGVSGMQRSLEGVRRDGPLHRDPLGLGEGLDVGLDAPEPGAGAREADAAERRCGLVVDGLVVDVHDA